MERKLRKNPLETPKKMLSAGNVAESMSELRLGILPSLVARQLRIAQLLVFKDFLLGLGESKLSPGSFEILELLSNNPGISHSSLANAISLDKSSLVPAISRLESLGFVERKQSATDKRSNELRITTKGGGALSKLREYVVQRESRITQGMSRREIETLNMLLKKIALINA
jgi:DNA-binding MarR family transcriptional regulator